MVSAAPKATERTIGMGVVQKGSLAYEHHSYEVIFHFLLVLRQFKFLWNRGSYSSAIFCHFYKSRFLFLRNHLRTTMQMELITVNNPKRMIASLWVGMAWVCQRLGQICLVSPNPPWGSGWGTSPLRFSQGTAWSWCSGIWGDSVMGPPFII